MASYQRRGDKWQLRVKHPLLPKPFFHSFSSEEEARSYGTQLEALLAAGVVPAELLERKVVRDEPMLAAIIAQYLRLGSPAPSDIHLLTILHREVGNVRILQITIQWVEQYVHSLKVQQNHAPGTIRKRVGSLARVLEWHFRRVTPRGEHLPANPFRLMPRGYSLYSQRDKDVLAKSGQGEVRHDIARNRRLTAHELQAILTALNGAKRPDRERPLMVDPDFRRLFQLIVNTGLRLSEAYRLRVEQVDLQRNVLNVEGSKGHRGKLKPRVVPLVPMLRPMLASQVAGKMAQDLVFPFWDGTEEGRPRAKTRLSMRFRTLFRYADVTGFTEHDLRHEATCRWFEMRDARGGWLFSEVEVCKIMGWSDTRMALRYASLRGEDLAARLL